MNADTLGSAESISCYADHVWLPHGWADSVRLKMGMGAHNAGQLLSTSIDTQRGDDVEYIGRFVLPGMPNLHSHAFQRAMAGLAESQTHSEDSFWTWREVMYRFASAIDPQGLKAIAAQLYVEMLKSGFTHVCEFHYLHRTPQGHHYADPAEMSLALIDAAEEAGIGLTLLPTLYMQGGFDGRALNERQKRFYNNVDEYLSLIERLRIHENARLKVGIALHSLRAVSQDALRAVMDSSLARECPIHIHIAEQLGEVQDCLAYCNARPVEWLLDHVPVDEHWCLVHATHINADEALRLANSGAVAGLCPTTEANLGDGLFALKSYIDANGVFGIGSDSHISVSPVEELRWLEYGQRLQTKHRNIAISELSASVAETLWGNALFGGASASGCNIGTLEADDGTIPAAFGVRTDLLVLNDKSPVLAARDTSNLLDSFIFSGNQNLVRDVMVGGKWVVRNFRHRNEEAIAERYCRTLEAMKIC